MCSSLHWFETLLNRRPARLLLMLALATSIFTAGCSTGGFGRSPATPAAAVEGAVLEESTEVTAGNPYLLDRNPVPADAANRFQFSTQAMAQSSWEIAEEGLVTLVKDYPQLSGPSLNLALVYRHANNNRQAEHWFRQSIARNKNNLLAYNQYAIFLREQGRFEQAEETYLKALAVWEPDADTHRNIGILYDLYRGDKKAALQHFYRYQELLNSEDRVVAGWIADLERQLTTVAGRGK